MRITEIKVRIQKPKPSMLTMWFINGWAQSTPKAFHDGDGWGLEFPLTSPPLPEPFAPCDIEVRQGSLALKAEGRRTGDNVFRFDPVAVDDAGEWLRILRTLERIDRWS